MKVIINDIEYAPIGKWAKEKDAFAEGKEIQRLYYGLGCSEWRDDTRPGWFDDNEYRIKPDPVKKWIWAKFDEHSQKWIFSKENLTSEIAAEQGYTHKLEFTEFEDRRSSSTRGLYP